MTLWDEASKQFLWGFQLESTRAFQQECFQSSAFLSRFAIIICYKSINSFESQSVRGAHSRTFSKLAASYNQAKILPYNAHVVTCKKHAHLGLTCPLSEVGWGLMPGERGCWMFSGEHRPFFIHLKGGHKFTCIQHHLRAKPMPCNLHNFILLRSITPEPGKLPTREHKLWNASAVQKDMHFFDCVSPEAFYCKERSTGPCF
eukprot:1139837-Pelagomonas_calceolata.AAC.5